MPNAFIPKKHQPNLNNTKWDEYYIDRELKDKVVKTGDGDEDFSIVKVVVESKRSIKETIDAQADDVGLENILRKFSLTGDDSILPESVKDNGQIVDMTQMPQDLMEADNYFKAQKAKFDALPDEIKNGRSFEEFMMTFKQKELDDYIEAYLAMSKPAEEKKGENE